MHRAKASLHGRRAVPSQRARAAGLTATRKRVPAISGRAVAGRESHGQLPRGGFASKWRVDPQSGPEAAPESSDEAVSPVSRASRRPAQAGLTPNSPPHGIFEAKP